MTPMAKIDSRDSAPPENRFTIPRIVLDRSAKKRATSAGFTPGTGMKVPMRYTTSAPMRNRTRLRISPKRAASLKAVAGLVRLVVAMALFQASILPPAASIAARAAPWCRGRRSCPGPRRHRGPRAGRGGGNRERASMCSVAWVSGAFLDAQQVSGGGDHAAVRRGVRHGHALVNAAQPEAARGRSDVPQLPVQAPHQRHFELPVRHGPQPVISSRLLPRLAAISSGERIFASAFMVARMTLIGLREP